jgi:hypothetical protein
MAKDDSHSLRNWIVATSATVVGGLILALIFLLPNVFRWLLHVIVTAARYFASFTSIPRWLFWLLVSLAAATLFRFLKPWFQRTNDEPTFRDYTKDSFEGITWRWSYDWNDNPINIEPFCPYCDTLLVHSESSHRGQTPKVSFYCERCKATRTEIEGGGRFYATSMIERFIDRNVRNGEWKRLIERNV